MKFILEIFCTREENRPLGYLQYKIMNEIANGDTEWKEYERDKNRSYSRKIY